MGEPKNDISKSPAKEMVQNETTPSDKPKIETEPKEKIENKPDNNSDQHQNTQNGVSKEIITKNDKFESPAEPMDDFDFDDDNELESSANGNSDTVISLKTFVSQKSGWE